jgi:hypothetical protein
MMLVLADVHPGALTQTVDVFRDSGAEVIGVRIDVSSGAHVPIVVRSVATRLRGGFFNLRR